MRKHRYSQTYLANLLIDGINGQSTEFVEKLIKKYRANPNINVEQGYSPMHFCAGLEDRDFAVTIINLFIAYDGDPNVQSAVEKYTPLHVACMNSNIEVARVLIDNGADVYAKDAEDNTPVHYATMEKCFKIVRLIRNEIYRDKQKSKLELRRRENAIKGTGTPTTLLQAVQMNNEFLSVQPSPSLIESSKNSTPSRIIYNFDRTSPYYINITHRKKSSPPLTNNSTPIGEPKSVDDLEKPMDIFELTEENLARYSKRIRESGKFELMNQWREKVNQSLQRKSILSSLNDIADILGTPPTPYDQELAMTDESFATAMTNGMTTPQRFNASRPMVPRNIDQVQPVAPIPTVAPIEIEDDQLTTKTGATYVIRKDPVNELDVPPQDEDDRATVISPRKPDTLLHWVEEYKHVDGDDNIEFKEVKICPAITDDNSDQRSASGISDSFKLDTDYDTDALRNELTEFGEPPGPITKGTKKLYLRRLVKYQRNPEQVQLMQKRKEARIYSVELEKVFKLINHSSECMTELFQLESEMVKHFQQVKIRNQREGKQKMSFIYLLLDPRELENLSINYTFMSRSEVFQKFLKAVFYVGKGKRHRPYAHLYEAMRYFANEVQTCRLQAFEKRKNFSDTRCDSGDTMACIRSVADLGPQHTPENQKLNKIVSIWKEKKGVVCLHVFHNITPVEAYTREAAMIDAIGISNLTNIKKGDYYGITSSWSMRQRKQLGVALLFKAMHIHLIEGESQLLPNDLF